MKGRIEVKAGHDGGAGVSPKYTVATFPFTDADPILGALHHAVKDRCQQILGTLSPHDRDVALMLIVAHYGNVVR